MNEDDYPAMDMAKFFQFLIPSLFCYFYRNEIGDIILSQALLMSADYIFYAISETNKHKKVKWEALKKENDVMSMLSLNEEEPGYAKWQQLIELKQSGANVPPDIDAQIEEALQDMMSRGYVEPEDRNPEYEYPAYHKLPYNYKDIKL